MAGGRIELWLPGWQLVMARTRAVRSNSAGRLRPQRAGRERRRAEMVAYSDGRVQATSDVSAADSRN